MTIYKINDKFHIESFSLDDQKRKTKCGLTIDCSEDYIKIGHDGEKFLPEPAREEKCLICFDFS